MIGAGKMSNAPNSNRIKKLLSLVAILVFFAVTIAAVCDWHSDLCYHPDCVLCQFAQLSLTKALTCPALPPPSISLLEISLVPILLNQSSPPCTRFNRGPPA